MSLFYTCILNAKYGVLQLLVFIAFSIQLVHPSVAGIQLSLVGDLGDNWQLENPLHVHELLIGPIFWYFILDLLLKVICTWRDAKLLRYISPVHLCYLILMQLGVESFCFHDPTFTKIMLHSIHAMFFTPFNV